MILLVAIVLGIAAVPTGQPVSETQAIELVTNSVHATYSGEPLHCFSFMIEEQSQASFEIAVRENQTRGCGGDPGVAPVRDRFRVDRVPVRLWIYAVSEDAYLPCSVTDDLQPRCPHDK